MIKAYINTYYLILIVTPIIYWLFLLEGKRKPKVNDLGQFILPNCWGVKLVGLVPLVFTTICFSYSLQWSNGIIVVDFWGVVGGLVSAIIGVLYEVYLANSKIIYSREKLTAYNMFGKPRTFYWSEFEVVTYSPRVHEFRLTTMKGDKVTVSLFRIGSWYFIDAAQKYLSTWVSSKIEKDFKIAKKGYRLM